MIDCRKNSSLLKCDVLVVGAGPAGCTAAIKAKEHGLNVVVLDKADPKWSGSAGRGIDLLHSLGALPSGQDAIKASQISYTRYYDEKDLANENMIYRLWEKENWAFAELEKYIDMKWYDGEYLWEGSGGAYSGASIRFAGLEIKPKLAMAMRQAKINVLSRTMLVDILMGNGRAVGATAVNTRTAEIYVIKAPAVIVATGSTARHLEPELPTSKYKYKYHHCPSALSGDGIAAAYRAGAELVNMELTEGSVPHSDYTCITKGCLIGVRPLRNREYTWDGEDLYTRNPNELSKRMYRELDRIGKTPVYRGLDHMPDDFHKRLEVNYIDEGFANLKLAGERGFNPRTHRFDVSRDKPYVVDASAVQMPGLATDENFMTTAPGLYAIGDAASCVGAVMSAVVTGFYVGDIVGDYIGGIGEIALDEEQAENQINAALAPLAIRNGQEPIEFESAIRQIDERYIGVFKSEGKLREGMRRLASLKKEFYPKLMAENPHYLMRCLEAKNIMTIAEVYMQACLSREETRGFFNRADFQDKDSSRDGKLTYQRFVNGEAAVEIREAPKLKPKYAGGVK
jgi:succinate dehydrogenase/fumarate reductase flavoprotein subunit